MSKDYLLEMQAVDEAVAQERERCAQVADSFARAAPGAYATAATRIASMIRKGPPTEGGGPD